MTVVILLGFVLVFVVFLAGCQRRLIYFPQKYQPTERRVIMPQAEEIEYKTNSGAQRAFYVKPVESPDKAPDRLWIFFCGNMSLALHWDDVIANPADKRAGFFLVDYPGYGYNEGCPTRHSINEASLAAFDALATRLKLTRAELASRTCLMGHSLGAAVALDLAVRLDPAPNQIVLFSPFTSLHAMARHVFCWPICCMVLDRFDNEARLNELAARNPRPGIVIIHGDKDQVIPVEQGRSLAAAHKGWITYHEVRNLDHNWIIGSTREIWLPLLSHDPSR